MWTWIKRVLKDKPVNWSKISVTSNYNKSLMPPSVPTNYFRDFFLLKISPFSVEMCMKIQNLVETGILFAIG